MSRAYNRVMRERIEHTPFAWERHGDRVVLYRRKSLRIVWGIGMFTAHLYTVALTPIIADVTDQVYPGLSKILAPLAFIAWIGLCYVFYRLFTKDPAVWRPWHDLQVNCGTRILLETRRIPVPTMMGGTLPGPPTHWLYIERYNRSRQELGRVLGEPDLSDVNLALS